MPNSDSRPGQVGALAILLRNFDQSETKDIKPLCLEVNLYQDIFAPCMSGNVVMADATGLASQFPIVGDELLDFEWASSGRDQVHLLPQFRTYKLENRTAVKERVDMYALHAASIPLVLDQTRLVTTAYQQLTASDMVQRIFTQYLKPLSRNPLATVEATAGLQTFTFPRMSPLRAIALLCSEAVSVAHPGSPFLFFETQAGYHFTTLASLFRQAPVETYYWTNAHVQEDSTGGYKLGNLTFTKQQLAISFIQHRAFDVLRGLTNGQYGLTMQYVDPLLKTYGSHVYQYNTGFPKGEKVGQTLDGVHATIHRGSALLQGAEVAHSRFHATRLPHASQFLRTRELAAGDTSSVRFRTQWAAQATASLIQLQNTATYLLAVPGYSKLAAGQCVDLVLPEMTAATKDSRQQNRYYSGRYLITSLCHRYTGGEYTTILECMRDSYTNKVEHIASAETGPLLKGSS